MIRFYDIELFGFSFYYDSEDFILTIEIKSYNRFYKIRCLLSDKDCVALKQLFYILKTDILDSIDLVAEEHYLKFLTGDNVDCIKINNYELIP